MPVRILGVSAYYHDSAACLVEDGRIVAAAQEERFTRKKHDAGFPSRAVEYCLREAGIGVASGQAVAGNVGAKERFEYTVIGEPVNEAARLTELAKLEKDHVLASAIAVSGALDAEALCWDVGEIVELRGRTAPTQLARPLNLVSASEVDEVSSDVRSST